MSNENNGLYLIVGALLVAVLVLGYLFINKTETGQDVVKETNTVIEKTVESIDEPDTSFSINVDEDGGFSASATDN